MSTTFSELCVECISRQFKNVHAWNATNFKVVQSRNIFKEIKYLVTVSKHVSR